MLERHPSRDDHDAAHLAERRYSSTARERRRAKICERVRLKR
jgi:hypothetical protein